MGAKRGQKHKTSSSIDRVYNIIDVRRHTYDDALTDIFGVVQCRNVDIACLPCKETAESLVMGVTNVVVVVVDVIVE